MHESMTGILCRMTARQIPAFRLLPEPLSADAEALLRLPPHVDPTIGQRHRLGGSPDFIQRQD